MTTKKRKFVEPNHTIFRSSRFEKLSGTEILVCLSRKDYTMLVKLARKGYGK